VNATEIVQALDKFQTSFSANTRTEAAQAEHHHAKKGVYPYLSPAATRLIAGQRAHRLALEMKTLHRPDQDWLDRGWAASEIEVAKNM